MTIRRSERLSRVKRIFDPYQDRRNFVRLDRNEDPVGWDKDHFREVINSLSPYDLSAYSDSTALVRKLSLWLDVKDNNIYVTAGSDGAIKNIFETYVDEDDKILLQKPSWPMYGVYCDLYRGEQITIEFDERLAFDTNAIIDMIKTRNIRMTVLANPHQPTGALIEIDTMKRILEIAFEKDTIVVVDEAYYLFSDCTCKELVSSFPNLIIVRTFSKAFGLAALRLGYCIADEERINELKLLRPVTDSNGIALKIGEYAIDNIEWILKRVRDFIEGREFLYHRFIENGIKTFKSHCNFLLLKCRSDEEAKDMLLKVKEKNYLFKGPFLFKPLEHCLRVTIGPQWLMNKFWEECRTILINR